MVNCDLKISFSLSFFICLRRKSNGDGRSNYKSKSNYKSNYKSKKLKKIESKIKLSINV